MKKITILLLTLLLTTACISQNIGDKYSEYKVYKNLKKALRNKSKVQFLKLSDKDLTSLPDNIGELKNVKVLNLDGNTIRNFPESFWQLEQLEVLILSQNKLDNLPEKLGSLKNLEQLYISRNNLSSLPEYLADLKKLKRIDASFNELYEKDGEFIRKALPDCFVLIDVIL